VKALILAAGRGERMRPLTDSTPKPLLEVGGRSLIEHTIAALQQAGIVDLTINLAHLGDQIRRRLGDGSSRGVRITYSPEPEGALDTGGGIVNALSKLGNDPFLVVNGDIWTDFPFSRLLRPFDGVAHLVLVDNPPHHPDGDFILSGDRVHDQGPGPRLTFSGIGVYAPRLFGNCQPGVFPLAPLLRRAMNEGTVSGEYFPGAWYDIGTPKRLAELDLRLRDPAGEGNGSGKSGST
jgi:MurNAc alpha-1-phosphate uridylyltransferase